MPVIALIIGALIAVADQVIKYFVLTYLQPVGSVTVIDGLLDLKYVENRGVAFGMFSDMRWFFVVVTAIPFFTAYEYALLDFGAAKFKIFPQS